MRENTFIAPRDKYPQQIRSNIYYRDISESFPPVQLSKYHQLSMPIEV